MSNEVKKKRFEVTYNLGYVSYEVEAEDGTEAEEIANKKRLDDGYISPNSELEEIKPLDDDIFYDEGDDCPKCKDDILVIMQDTDTGINTLKCQKCGYDATDDIKEFRDD